jgi:hypothetical protein
VTALDIVVLAAAGLAGGFVTALAGGSSFFTFPALIFAGVGPVAAVATGAVASLPGNLAGGVAGWRHLTGVGPRFFYWNALALIGGTIGAVALIAGGDAILGGLVPWLLLLATLSYAFGPSLRAVLARRAAQARPSGAPIRRTGPALSEFLLAAALALYGGYFGAGLGIMLLAALGVAGIDDPHRANAYKNVLAVTVTVAAIVVVIAAGAVSWPHAGIIVLGTILGGWGGARAAERVPARWLRRVIIAIGGALTIWFFWHR